MFKRFIKTIVQERGDTLIEVTMALTILSMVLASSTAIATMSMRVTQTARERTQVSDQAQQQMEALRSMRDSRTTWDEFLHGWTGCGSCGVFGKGAGFHMSPQGSNPNNWMAVAGPLNGGTNPVAIVPTSTINIMLTAQQSCLADFRIDYRFTPLGGGGGVDQTNHITARLVNTSYQPSDGACAP